LTGCGKNVPRQLPPAYTLLNHCSMFSSGGICGVGAAMTKSETELQIAVGICIQGSSI